MANQRLFGLISCCQTVRQSGEQIQGPLRKEELHTKVEVTQVNNYRNLLWTPPKKGYKLNSDGSSKGIPPQKWYRGVSRDTNGEWIVGYMGNLYMANNVNAELTALMQGLGIALARGLLPLEINVDCKEIITFTENDHPSKQTSPPIHHTFRKANRVADALAREGSQIYKNDSFFFLEVSPVFPQRSIPTSTNCNSYEDIVSSQNYTSRHIALPLPCNNAY
ncbi:hypothetical protein R3W88_000903 [Solanum pinnatisectum]|uniref:RNase H type-1 domain-containing protein n=1 Tax=Solanum pinnatisectum TaxID=50273 RepID=A0AAV9MHE7_9SOLN|nr:hypothetical protein R3W88_000903 [Solanum pinnatisectum]